MSNLTADPLDATRDATSVPAAVDAVVATTGGDAADGASPVPVLDRASLPVVGYFELFKYHTAADWCLVAVASVFSLINGLVMVRGWVWAGVSRAKGASGPGRARATRRPLVTRGV